MDAPLKFDKQRSLHQDRERSDDFFAISELIEVLIGFVRRQLPIFIFILSCSIALGLVYLFTTPPKYTAHAMLLIDSSKLRVLQQQQAPIGDIPIDMAQVETQVEILKSENIGLAVVKDLKLVDDPEFVGSGGGLLGKLFGAFKPAVESEDQLARKALRGFLDNRDIARVGRTYVLDIGFTSLNGARAATIANAVAEAYIVDQLESKYQATKRASKWLQDRIKELRQQASDADRAVLDYKEKNKIVAVGGVSASGGPRLLGEQQLEDLNTQLGTARAAAEEAKARFDRINDVMQKDVPDATVTDSLKSEVINRLRNQYLDISAKEAIWAARYGADHLAAVNLRTQMAELRRSIHDELGRIQESYKSDYEISKTRVEGLERELQKLVASSQVTNRDRLGLTDLESTAKVYHSIYDNFLQRYMEAIQQESFPITEARVISAAAAPEQKSSPKTSYVLELAGFIGLVISFGASLLRESIDQVFRTTRQIESVLHTACLAVLPNLEADPRPREKILKWFDQARGKSSISDASSSSSVVELAVAAARSDKRLVPQPTRNSSTASGAAGARMAEGRKLILRNHRKLMRQVIDEPLSAFAEAFRSIKVAADIAGSRRESKVIGVTSTLPKEGKSTISSNLAQLIAHAGKQIILLDGDLRNPSLTRSLTPNAKKGLLEVLNNQVELNQAVFFDEDTGLSFLPAVIESRVFHTNEILASEGFKELLEKLRKVYDYIIVDFPPMAPVVDVRATTEIIDSYIYVIEWGKTSISLIQHQLQTAPELHDRLLGVVLNKANVGVLARYESYYGRYYHKNYYGGQYPYSA